MPLPSALAWSSHRERVCSSSVVPAGRVVVAGDNERSVDSRALGFIDVNRTATGHRGGSWYRVAPRWMMTWLVLATIGCRPVDPGSTRGPASSAPSDGTPPTSPSLPSPTGTGATPERGEWWLVLDGPVDGPVTDPVIDGGPLALDATPGPGLRFVEGHPAGTVGVAFSGDGSGLTVDAPDLAALDLGSDDPFTVEVGFRTDVHGREGDAGSAVLVERDGGWSLSIVDGHPTWRLGDDAIVNDRRVDDGRWHRLVATRDTELDEVRLTVDGASTVRLADPIAGSGLSGGHTLSVGAAFDGTHGLLGAIDHVAVRKDAAAPFADVPADAHATVFLAGSDPVPGGGTYTSIRIPAWVQSSDGSLVAFAKGRVDDSCDFGDIDVVSKRSTDGGLIWSPVQRVNDNGSGKAGNPVPFYDADRDRLVLLSTATDVEGPCGPPVAGSVRVRVQHSDDHGVTWSDPVDVTSEVTDPSWNSAGLLGPSHGIQLRSPENAGALILHGMHDRSSDNGRGGHLLVSRDGGDHWSIADWENSSAPTVEVNEGTVSELGDGRLYVNVRHQVGDPEPERESGMRGQAFVNPDLTYAADPPFARTTAFRGPVVHGTTLRWVGSERYGDEPRILFSYPGGEYGSNFGQRHDLRLYASGDDAVTFAPGVRIYGGKASYSDLVALDDVRVGVLYETALDSEDYNTRIELRTRLLQELDDPTLVGWTFEEGEVGAVVTSTSSSGPERLVAEGTVERVAGRHHSTAVHLDGSRLCASDASLGHRADLGLHDGLEVEVSFRTTAHGSGGGTAAGTLAAKTAVGTDSAWWLRVEDSHARFAVGDEAGHLDIVTSDAVVSDGAFHTVRAIRDPENARLTLAVDGGTPVEVATTTTGYVANTDSLCVGRSRTRVCRGRSSATSTP